ncbi:alpha/beta hydrolase [Lentzea tibetensis]|uniref:Alpha/beta hydrolase n=1 Tax=Lentzea tibetensis TaxID=2591470 RepID=A0A563EHW9_9PSEU|nr:dienelactone hydrolase family protein [Lentzea tibetensis]TWP46103.1 alpha/beta hydrolase [Lentzea tibetensis]
MLRLLLAVSLLVAGLAGTAAADEVRTAEYELTPGLPAVVHHPADISGVHPLVVILHGYYATCADRNPNGELYRWPCAEGIEPIPSYRGYDYLGGDLAAKGFVVVSINANHINGGQHGPDDFADRAALINEHLAAWQRLSASGEGPLAGAFGELRGHVDMTSVGVMGHSKGGRSAARHSADGYHGEWPQGVRVKAVIALEPIPSGGADSVVSQIPFMTVIGACDKVSNPAARQYFEDAATRNTAPLHLLTVHGANHTFFNTQWSPSSGQVDSGDDADHDGVAPGNCRTNDASHAEQKQLTEEQQRIVGAGYLSAFFQRYLKGETRFDPVLTGADHPFEHITEVDVEHDQ